MRPHYRCNWEILGFGGERVSSSGHNPIWRRPLVKFLFPGFQSLRPVLHRLMSPIESLLRRKGHTSDFPNIRRKSIRTRREHEVIVE